MNDPFFDEDDGEFDDLYGNPPPTASPTVKQKPRTNESTAMQSVTPGSRISTQSPAASSSVISRSYARDSLTSTTTDLAASGKQVNRRKRHGKPRRKGSQELFDVQWESDEKVAKCGLCRSDFSLVRRKHHCRHCGRVMCSDCSSFLYFEFSHRKHRVCASCNNQLLAEQETYDQEAVAAGDQRETNLFEDSNDDCRPSVTPVSSSSNDVQINNRRSTLVSAFASKHGDGDEKARKKQEKKERKERKKKGEVTQVMTPAMIPPREQAKPGKDNPSTSLFDGAGDDWFTDVPGQRRRSRDSDDGYSENDGSKGPGWRDRVKKNYTVTAASGLASMTDRNLTAGITGKGYISDQFRYDDVGGPSLGHDDDLFVEMPRPKQQSTTTTYIDRSVKPSRLAGNGYFSEQFQYDDEGGPGVGHDDDRSIAMPRPKQQPADTPFRYDSAKPSERRSEHGSFDNSVPPEQDFDTRLTFKENLKEIFSGTNRRESTTRKTERKVKASKPRARGNENMTLDELNPSYSSEDEPRILTSAVPRPAAQPTFYDNADKLVVDKSPGFFDATIAEREAQLNVEEEQQRQHERDMAWVNSLALPPTVPAHRFSSEQESYSIVDRPSRTSNSPVESHRGGSADEEAGGNTKGGFTGALKRFFGMGSKGGGKRAATPPKPAKVPSTPVVTAPEKDPVDKVASSVPNSTVRGEPALTASAASGGLERHTVLDYYGVSQKDQAPQASFRNTMTGHVDTKDATYRVKASVRSQRVEASQEYQEVQQKPERQRRGTFDDLFESPKANMTGNADRYSTTGGSGWSARLGDNTSAGEVSFSAATVGVSRFNQRRSVDEIDGFTLGDEPRSVQHSTQAVNDPIEAWRRSAAMSLLDDRKDGAQSEPGFTWSNVRSTPEFGTASYAVPTSLQSRAAYDDNNDSSFQYDTPATQPTPLGNIMDDLKRVGTAKKAQGQESVDDFFAEFEEPNDYVFDPATGGYVAARVPPRAELPRHITRPDRTEHVVPHNASVRSSERDYSAATKPIASSADRTVAPEESNGEEVGDEVAEIIVDKISSLESELAALKQLIRSRKGSGGSNKPRIRHKITKPSVRKESIFDNDSSEEDNAKPGDLYSSPVSLLSKKTSKRRPPSKRSHSKKRKDSFADLFEDSPNENGTLGGATSYEALFQAEDKAAGRSKDEDSADEELSPKPAKKRSKSRRRSSRKINYYVSHKEDSDSEPEFSSLKGRRGKESSGGSGGKLAKSPPVDVVPVVKPVKIPAEEDPIDALFDTSDGNDVTKLYGTVDDHEEVDSTHESKSAPILEVTSTLLTQASSTFLTDDEESGTLLSTAATTESVVPMSSVNSGFFDSQGVDEVEEEEKFSINWSKMRKTKSRRRKPRRGSSKTVGEDVATDNKTDDRLLELHQLDARSEAEVRVEVDEERQDVNSAAPSSYLADAASNWMSVSTVEEEAMDLNLTGGIDLASLLQTVDEKKDPESIAELVPTSEDIIEDKQVSTSNSVSMESRASTQESTEKPNLGDAISTEESNDPQKKPLIAKATAVEKVLATPKLKAAEEDTAFDIFDKSGDVNFLSVSSRLGMETYDNAVGDDDSEGEGRESLPGNEDAFSFEIKVYKKQLSPSEIPVSIPSPSRQEELPPPSSASSMDENMELGKYAASSIPSSSRTPSVDDSLDDPEDVWVGEEPELGKVESQAFDTDWQQMQAKEKERKKKLQMKQRQAQRDKLLRKQGVSSKSLSSSDATHSSSKNKSKSGKKKKKDKEKDTSASSSSRQKKSSSSRKHRHREKEDRDHAAPSEPPRSLTEL
ncbi:hypothetical protein V7S43_000351 [Phytophthora oleae]|uniref:FYVE-type domain-containing protein n=1 Tax=Phytophthora oleae TaxID=2107226 RepID=A0ABD3G8Z6_9STRA